MTSMTSRNIVLVAAFAVTATGASAGCGDIDVNIVGDGNNVRIDCPDKPQTVYVPQAPVFANFCVARNAYGQVAVWERFNPSVRLAPGMFCTFSPLAVMTYGYTVGIATVN